MSDLKAPWSVHVDHQTSPGRFDVFSSEGHLVAVAKGERAKLICAAPELLEACLRIQAQFRQAGVESKAGSLNPIEDSAAQIDAAISKALGQ